MADQISKNTAMDLLCAEFVNVIKTPRLSESEVKRLHRRIDSIVRGVYTAGFEEGKAASIRVIEQKYQQHI